MNFHAACGLFAAIGTAPELVPPSTWLELIKGKHVFEDLASAQALTQGVMMLYSEVLSSLADHGAHCCPDPSDEEAVREFRDLYAYWAEGRRAAAQRLAQRATPARGDTVKVGRNDPCPCGSGKKFKKCCAH